MRSVFFGTPEIAVPSLIALTSVSTVVGVVSQPDRPAGRGLGLRAPAVKLAAEQLGLPVVQPLRPSEPSFLTWFAERDCDVAVVLAYGRILPPSVLSTPHFGCLNLHASCLPRHRGAAPIPWAILSGDTRTGVTLMHMDEGLDTGPLYLTLDLPILEEDDTGTLSHRIAELAAEMIRGNLQSILEHRPIPTPQEVSSATWAPPLKKEDEWLDFGRPALKLARQVRALAPRPSSYTTLRGKRLRVLQARACPQELSGAPGHVSIDSAKRVLVATAGGSLELLRVQLEGRKVISAIDLVHGRALLNDERLGQPPSAI